MNWVIYVLIDCAVHSRGLLGAHFAAQKLKEQGERRLKWYKDELVWKADELGQRLLPAFNTTTGLPYARVRSRNRQSTTVPLSYKIQGSFPNNESNAHIHTNTHSYSHMFILTHVHTTYTYSHTFTLYTYSHTFTLHIHTHTCSHYIHTHTRSHTHVGIHKSQMN